MKTPREMTATEVAAARYVEERRTRGMGRRTYPPTSGLYDQTDVDLHGAKIAAGHNPDGVTVVQVGAGWRLLAPEEICRTGERLNSTGFWKDIQAWEEGWNESGWDGNSPGHTYRTARPPGFFLPAAAAAAKVAVDVESGHKSTTAATWVDEKFPVTDAEAIGAAAAPPPDARRYVHTFVCNACSRTCTMETVSASPLFSTLPSDMLCPFRLPGFTAIWKAGPVQTLT